MVPTPNPTLPEAGGLPPAEAGVHTSEFYLAAGTTLLLAVFGLLAAFGLSVSAAQKTAILEVIAAALPLAPAVYALGRSIRKRGTVA